MRKSFTRFFSVLLVILFGISAMSYAQTLSPTTGNQNKATVKLTATFSGDVSTGSGYVRLYEDAGTIGTYTDDVPLFIEPVPNPKVQVSGKVVTFLLNQYLEDNKTYYISYEGTVFKVGNTNQPAKGAGAWSFATGDYTVPTLADASSTLPFSPKNGAVNRETEYFSAPLAPISVTFNEPVAVGTGKIYLMKDNGTAYGDVFEIFSGAAAPAAGKFAVNAGNNKQIDITPSKDLTADNGSKYYIMIEGTAVKDVATPQSNYYAGFLNNTTWSFSTKDETAPDVSFTIDANKTKVFGNITASEAGKVYVYTQYESAAERTSADVKGYAAAPGTIPGAIGGQVITLTFTAAGTKPYEFTVSTSDTPGTLYEVFVVSETQLASGVANVLSSDPPKKDTKTTVDGVPPTAPAQSYDPANAGTSVGKDAKLKLTFLEDVKIGTGKIYVYKYDTNQLWFSDELSTVASATNKVVTIDFPSSFASQMKYYVLIDNGAILDKSDNKFAGYSLNSNWVFTAADYAAPTYTFFPVDGTTNANSGGAITITFDEPIEQQSGNAIVNGASVNADGLQEAFELKENGTVVAHTYTYTAGANPTITIVPTATGSLKSDAEYTLVFYAYWIQDQNATANAIKTSSEISFKTKDTTLPFVSKTEPTSGTLVASDNMVITMSEPIRLATGAAEINNANVGNLIELYQAGVQVFNFTCAISDDKKVITVDPGFSLSSATTYTVKLSANIEDMAGNDIAGITTHNFATKDFILPTVTLAPATGTLVDPTTAITVTFSEGVTFLNNAAITGVNAGTLITLKEGGVNGNDVALTTAVGGNVITVTAALNGAKTYYFAVGAAVKDATGNVNEAVSSTFTTKSSAAPALDIAGKKVSPNNGTTNQPLDVAITAIFTDPVLLANASLITVNDGVSNKFVSASLGTDKKTLTIVHSALVANATATVTIPVGTVTSETGTAQPFGGFVWSFGTSDTNAPALLAAGNEYPLFAGNPAAALVAVSKSTTKPYLVFNEKVQKGTGSMYLRRASDNYLIQTLSVSDISLSSGDTKVTITLKEDLAFNTEYFLQIPAGVIEDVAGNDFVGILDDSWDFQTVATPGAFTVDVPKSNPTNLQFDVPVAADLVAKFNRAVAGFDNNFDIMLDEGTYAAGGAFAVTSNIFQLPPNDGIFTWDSSTLTINPTANLAANKFYRLRFEAGVVKDSYNTTLGLTDIYFSTGSAQGPKASLDLAGATKVVKSTDMVVTFDEPFFKSNGTTAILASDVQTGYINLNGSVSGANLPFIATISGNIITINPTNDFASEETVTVTVPASLFYDSTAKTYDASWDGTADAQTFTFTIADTRNPVASVSLFAANSGTEVKYQVTSDEKGIAYAKVYKNGDAEPTADDLQSTGTAVSISTAGNASPSTANKVSGLLTKTGYKLAVVAKDETGNVGSVVSSAVLTTPDDVAPVLKATAPTGTKENNNVSIVIEFDENIAANAGSVIVREKATGVIVEYWNVAALGGAGTTSTISGKKLTLNLGVANGAQIGLANYASATTYVVDVDPSAIKDQATTPNAYKPEISFEFTVKDFVAPTIVKTKPDLTVAPFPNVVNNGNELSLEFSEPVISNDGRIEFISLATASTIEILDTDTLVFSNDRKTVHFHASHKLLNNETYNIVVPATAFKDDGGNALAAGIANGGVFGTNWRIIIKDQEAPVASRIFDDPASAATSTSNSNVDGKYDILINFDEAIRWVLHPSANYLVDANIDSLVTIVGPSGAVPSNITFPSATQIKIDPNAQLKSFTTYTVTVSQVQDASGNKMQDYTFSFTTKDGDAPAITFNPGNKSDKSNEMGPFEMNFSEAVYGGFTSGGQPVIGVIDNNIVADYVELWDVAGAAQIPFTATINSDYTKITITPKAKIGSGKKIRYGFINDGAGPRTDINYSDYNKNAAAAQDIIATATNSAVSFAETTIRDYAVPTLTATSPALTVPASTTPALASSTADLTMTFNEKVAVGSGNLYIRDYITGEIVTTVEANPTNVTIDGAGTKATIKHAALDAKKAYYVTVESGFVKDLSNNPYAGINDNQLVWGFNTKDLDGPQIADKFPRNQDVDVLVTKVFQLVFDKEVSAGVGNLVIYKKDGTPVEVIDITNTAMVDFNKQYLGGDTIVTVKHSALIANSEYFVRLDKGAVVDKVGNPNSGIQFLEWTFKTEDTNPPAVTNLTPLDDKTGVDLLPTFTVEFDRSVLKGTSGSITVWNRPGNVEHEIIPISSSNVDVVDLNKVTFTLTKKLAELTDYYVVISNAAITNASVNRVPYPGISNQWTWNFTTGTDATAPTLVSVSPDAATGLKPADVKLEITLNEDAAVATTGNIVIYNAATDAIVKSTPVTDPSVTVVGPKVTVTLAAGTLAEKTSYYVLVDNGALTDKAVTPNAFAGITDKTRWTFATGDFTAPKKVSVTPNATTLTDNHPILVLTMDEAVKLTSTGGSVTITKAGTTTTPVTIPLTAAMISADGKTITITYTASVAGGLDKNTDYFVTVPAGALEDNAGNDFTGITTATEWVFKTGAFATPTDPVIGSSLKVYPNPFVNELRIDNASKLSRIIINSMTGQKVKEIVNPTSTIQTNDLRSGVYFISLYDAEGNVQTERIVKR